MLGRPARRQEPSCGEAARFKSPLPSAPRRAVRELVGVQAFRLHLDRVAGVERGHVAAVLQAHGVEEMLVQMVDILDDPVLQAARDADVVDQGQVLDVFAEPRSEENTSELQSIMRISYDVFCLKKKNNT